MTATCTICQFKLSLPYKLDDGAEGVNLFCRRYPPTLLPTGNQSATPPVSPDGWCGEFQRAAPAKRVKS